MSVETARELSIERTIAASPEAVWDAWTRPEQMAQWACPAEGVIADVDIDLRVGGAFRIRMVIEDTTYTAFGTYREIDAPKRLVYTWDWQEEANRMGDTLVRVEFVPSGDGTEVRLRHEGFPAAEAKDGHEEGWNGCFARLEALLRG